MPKIDVDDATFRQLSVSSRLMRQPVGEVVRLLLLRLLDDAPPPPAVDQKHPEASPPREVQVAAPQRTWVSVHKVYLSKRVEGEFNPSTMEVRITTSPWSGKVFNSPTAAARAVVEKLGSGDRQTSNTNGRKFWHLADGQDLRSLVGTRF